MPGVEIRSARVHFGEFLSVGFHRTLRVPDGGEEFPLPPGLGQFPIFEVERFRDRLPDSWVRRGGGFIPMYQREAMWLGFDCPPWRPCAVMVHVGGINAVSGERDAAGLRDDPQNYVVCPDQLWLDGVNTGRGSIRQFVAMPLGEGYTVEAAITGEEALGGLRLTVFDPRPGLFPEQEPPPPLIDEPPRPMAAGFVGGPGATMGLGAGGRIRQKVYPDEHGIDTWDQADPRQIEIHILNSEWFEAVTGERPPATPVDPVTYTEHGLPWFDLYDESRGDVAPPEGLESVRTVAQVDDERGVARPAGPAPSIDRDQIRTLGGDDAAARSGADGRDDDDPAANGGGGSGRP